MKDVLRLKKRKAVTPIAPRTQCDKYVMTPCGKAATQIDDMPLGAAKVSSG